MGKYIGKVQRLLRNKVMRFASMLVISRMDGCSRVLYIWLHCSSS